MKGKKEVLLGIGILVILILVIIAIKAVTQKGEISDEDLTTVYVATGGGKENFLADEEVINIMEKKYGLDVEYDSWSNGKLIKNPLVREDGTQYDVMFASDQRFYDYYKLAPDTSKG